ncbi:MAG: glycine oxidase ThiO [Gammaproteobacteria bacterium]
MNSQFDVIVVGGGIIGLMTARELRREGLSVAVLDRGQMGREASRAAGGILSPLYPWRSPQPVAELARWSQEYYPLLARDLLRHTGIDPEWTASGLLIFDAEARENLAEWSPRAGVHTELIDAEQLAVNEPALAGCARPAVFLPAVAQIETARLLRALCEAVLAEGVPLHQHCPVEEFIRDGSAVAGVRSASRSFHAERVVVACGAWSGQVLSGLGLALPVEPVRGQMLQFAGPPGLLGRILLEDRHYVVPRRDGRILVGSTVEHAGFDTGTTEEARMELREFAVRLLPLLDGAVIQRHWAGLRPGSPNGMPFIGPVPGIPGLFVNAGHYTNGIMLAPSSARLLADQLLERVPILDPTPFAWPE